MLMVGEYKKLSDFEKIASVTMGGKPYFYVIPSSSGAWCWVVWNRVEKKWAVKISNERNVAFFDDVKLAKLFLIAMLNGAVKLPGCKWGVCDV